MLKNYDDEKQKYLKYKLKYLNLLNKMGGSSANTLATPLILQTKTDDKTDNETNFNERIKLLTDTFNKKSKSFFNLLSNEIILTTSINYENHEFNVELTNVNSKLTYTVCFKSKDTSDERIYSKYKLFEVEKKFQEALKYNEFKKYADYFVQNRIIVNLTSDDSTNKQTFETEIKTLISQYQITDLKPLEKLFKYQDFIYKVSLNNSKSYLELSYSVSIFTFNDKKLVFKKKHETNTLSFEDLKSHFEDLDEIEKYIKQIISIDNALDLDITDESQQNEIDFNERMIKLKKIFSSLGYSMNTYIKYDLLFYEIKFEYDEDLEKECYHITIGVMENGYSPYKFSQIRTDNDTLNYQRFISFVKAQNFKSFHNNFRWAQTQGWYYGSSLYNARIILDKSGKINLKVYKNNEPDPLDSLYKHSGHGSGQ